MDDCLQNIFLWHDAFHVFNQIIGLSGLVILQIENYQIQSCLGDDVDKRWKHLKCVFSTSEDDKVVSEQIIVLEKVS